MFIAKNPEISLAQVTTFVKLGMFDKIYPGNPAKEKERCHGNRKEMEAWITEHGDEAKAYGLVAFECCKSSFN